MKDGIPKSKIYTKKGDQGKTHLVDGSCVDKFNPRVEAYGVIDELNSYLGVVRAHLQFEKLPIDTARSVEFFKIQNLLFCAGSILACSDPDIQKKLPLIKSDHLIYLENAIDEMTLELPELKNFILPGGCELSSHLHVCRTLCRRAERRTAEILTEHSPQSEWEVLKFLNRLSDYFFTAARWILLKKNLPEYLWDKSI